jgi:2-polyprenyl-6-methoxyphenol hydroxylase-like FAD-dependent oxidoreductase
MRDTRLRCGASLSWVPASRGWPVRWRAPLHQGTPVPSMHAQQARVSTGALVRLLSGWGGLPGRMAAALDLAPPTAMRRVASVLRQPPWCRGAVLCVGTAAHAMAPPFGQSAAQALEDAVGPRTAAPQRDP